DIAISLYLPEDAGVPTSHLFGLRPTYVSSTGDFTGAASIQSPAATTQSYYWLAGVDVLSPEIAGTLVTFGDSITDGSIYSGHKPYVADDACRKVAIERRRKEYRRGECRHLRQSHSWR